MSDSFKEKKAGAKPMSQLEMDAQAMREKTARLRELRLAHEAANGPANAKPAPAPRRAAPKKKPNKSSAQSKSLAEWLDSQQNQGRRS